MEFKVSQACLELLSGYVEELDGQIFLEETLKFRDLGFAETEDGQFQCLACSSTYTGKRGKGNAKAHFLKSHVDQSDPNMGVDSSSIMGKIQVSSDHFEVLSGFIGELGGQTFVEKNLNFEDMELIELQNGAFQCQVCNSTYTGKRAKGNAKAHYLKSHVESNPITIQCPRCDDEVTKANLNGHMEQKHELKKFSQLMQRSFKPGLPGTSTGIIKSEIPEKKMLKPKVPAKKVAKPKLPTKRGIKLEEDKDPAFKPSTSSKLPKKMVKHRAPSKRSIKEEQKIEPEFATDVSETLEKIMVEAEKGMDPLAPGTSEIPTERTAEIELPVVRMHPAELEQNAHANYGVEINNNIKIEEAENNTAQNIKQEFHYEQ